MKTPQATFCIRDKAKESVILKSVQLKMNLPIEKVRIVYTVGQITLADWNEKKKRSRKDESFNNLLNKLETVAREAYLNFPSDGHLTRSEFIKQKLDEVYGKTSHKAVNPSFMEFVDLYIKEKESITKKGTTARYKTARRTLQQFIKYRKIKDLSYTELNPFDWLISFRSFCNSELKHRNNNIAKTVKIIKSILKDAHDRGFHSSNHYQHRKFSVSILPVFKVYLSEAELKTIFEHPGIDALPGHKIAADLFLVGAFTGLRISDFLKLRDLHVKGDNIVIRTTKTNYDTTIPINTKLRSILDKYNNNLPKLSEAKINKYIKEVCQLCKIDELTETTNHLEERIFVPKYALVSSHTARRSFVTNRLLEGWKPIRIRLITGHKDDGQLLEYSCLSEQDKLQIINGL